MHLFILHIHIYFKLYAVKTSTGFELQGINIRECVHKVPLYKILRK
jgi:hypothetical protein